MRRARQLLIHTSALTASGLLMRSIAMVFQVYVAGRIGAAGIGLFQLVMSVYTLATTVATSGIRLAATRLIAQQSGKNDPQAVRKATRCVLGYSLIFGSAAMLLLFGIAPTAGGCTGDLRTVLSLRVLAFALPFVASSAAMGGYFIALHQSVKISAVQLAEQIIRILFTVLALAKLGDFGLEYSCAALTLGMLASEVFSFTALFILLLLHHRSLARGRSKTPMVLPLLQITVPLSLSSYARSALSTVQHLLVPRGLKLYGGDAEAALAAYGVIQGMALPVLLFPAAVISVIADLIVPELTEAQVQGRLKNLTYMLQRLYRLGLIFAIAVGGCCLFFAEPLGMLIYRNADAGRYIRMLAPLVPAMYMDTLVDGMLKGVGEYRAHMRYNIIDSAVGLLLVWSIVPRFGVGGYLFSIAATELLNFALSASRLTRVTDFRLRLHLWGLDALCLAGGYLSVSLLFGELLQRRFTPAGLIVGILLLLAGYFLLLRLSGGLTKEEILWLKGLVKGENRQKSKKRENRRKTA